MVARIEADPEGGIPEVLVRVEERVQGTWRGRACVHVGAERSVMAVAHASPETRARMCQRDGCARPHVLGDRFCFDHLDPDELERAINETDDEEEFPAPRALPAREEREEEARDVKTKGRMDKWTCGCGRFETDWPAARARHQMKCDGTPVATVGRIAASSTSREVKKKAERRPDPPRAKTPVRASAKRPRPSVPRKTKTRTIRMQVPRQIVLDVRDKFLDQLRAERAKFAALIEKIDETIRNVEALA